jgi:cytochrome c oxidase assembly protein subunit 11
MTGRASLKRRQARTVLFALGMFGVMSGLTSYSVTLYRLFCQATGYGGTTRTAAAAPTPVDGRVITVRFNTDVNSRLPWRFEPEQRAIKVKLGEEALAVFRAENLGSKPITGHAVYNVTPAKAGIYFNKIQCFCFTEQTLDPRATAEMPVQFFVDPDLAKDRNLDDVEVITLSYTFFRQSGAPDSGGTLN